MKCYVCRLWKKTRAYWRPVEVHRFETIADAQAFGRVYTDQSKVDHVPRDFDVYITEVI